MKRKRRGKRESRGTGKKKKKKSLRMRKGPVRNASRWYVIYFLAHLSYSQFFPPLLRTYMYIFSPSLPPSLLPSLSFFLSLLLCHIHASYWSLSRLYVDRLSSYCPMPRKPTFILSHPCPSYSIVLLFRRIRDCRLWLDKSGRKEMPKH